MRREWCSASAKAEDAIRGQVSLGRHQHDYFNAAEDIACATGSSSEGEIDVLDPPAGINDVDLIDRYHEHVRLLAAGEVGHKQA